MSSNTQLEQVESPALGDELSGQSLARRRLLRGAAAAPVLLVSGRSALACDPTRESCALSPMAWMSVHPNGSASSANLSHAVGCNFLGKSPGFWTPNVSPRANAFQSAFGKVPWVSAGLKAFETLTWHKKDGSLVTVPWEDSKVLDFKGLRNRDQNDPQSPGRDAGWNSGAKLPFYGGRSIARILLDENASMGILWHICAAYLNAITFPGEYALTVSEVKDLYETKKLIPSATSALSDGDIKAFLNQTWV